MSHRHRGFIVLFEIDFVLLCLLTKLVKSIEKFFLLIRLIGDDLGRNADERVLQG